ncbi:uncharacterized protein LOC130991685 isoform X1 [Salvia miltiorrhiza]|uniref:uncharacterized protein LOC130991685 isoform X1 n=1 Tax=Salvia miltiorrhiza TaxID=226208 RepID=UPI0025AC66D0|nr:uncharacterized protein LOC130991685 isoform X1 [Salvia miltiorrhiza]
MEGLTEDEKKALRGSKFAPLPPGTNQTRPQSRLAHPGGPMKTNKAAALAKFLERKLQEPNGLASVDPKLVELAVRNAKQTVQCSGASTSGRIVHHVNKFDDVEDLEREDINGTSLPKKLKQKKKKKKKEKNQKKKQKKLDDSTTDVSNRPKKKLKL